MASRYSPPSPLSPSALLSPRMPTRRSAIVGVGKRFVEGALGAGVCAVRNFYAGDGAVCRGSISEQHPLDFQGFRIDSQILPHAAATTLAVPSPCFLSAGSSRSGLPPRTKYSPAVPGLLLFRVSCPDIVPLLGLTSDSSTEINDRFIRSEVARVCHVAFNVASNLLSIFAKCEILCQ